MNFDQEVTLTKEKIADAERLRDALRASSEDDKYLEACYMVNELCLHLENLRVGRQMAKEARLHGPGALD